MDRFNKFGITCTLMYLMDYLNLSMTVHDNGSVSVVTHKLIQLNKTCMVAILKALSTVMNENRGNKVFTAINQLNIREYSKTLTSHLIIIFI